MSCHFPNVNSFLSPNPLPLLWSPRYPMVPGAEGPSGGKGRAWEQGQEDDHVFMHTQNTMTGKG